MFQERDSIRKNSIALGAFALVTALLLATTYEGTKDEIAAAIEAVEQKTLLEIIPLEQHSNNLLMDVLEVPEAYWPLLGLDQPANIHIARNDQLEPIAIILPSVAPDGYSGKIHMIIGINIDGSLAGVRVTEHAETPGLGDKVELKKSDWILGFNGKSLQNPTLANWKVKKDRGEFDQFTGATITPRAVVQQVAKTLQYYREDQQRLLRAANRSKAKLLQNNAASQSDHNNDK